LVTCLSGLTFFVQRFVVWSVLYLLLSIPLSFPSANKDEWRLKASLLSDKNLYLKLSGGLLLFFLMTWPFFPITHGRCQRLQSDIFAIKRWIPEKDNVLTDPDVGSCLLLEASPLSFKIGMDTRFDYYGGAFLQQLREKKRLALFLSAHRAPAWVWMQRSWLPKNVSGYRLAWQGQHTQLWQKW
jgi:hypothetical protein